MVISQLTVMYNLAGGTHVMFPNCHNVILGDSSSTHSFDIVDRYITHHLPGNITDSTVSVGC